MPHHKQAATPQTSFPFIPSLLCFEGSALALCTRKAYVLERVLLHKEHELVSAGLKLPDICLKVRKNPKNLTQETCPNSGQHATTCSTAVDLNYKITVEISKLHMGLPQIISTFQI